MTKILLYALLAGSAFLSGCATPVRNPDDVAAKSFQPPSGQASLYLCRAVDTAGRGTSLQTILDDQLAGVLPPGTYQCLYLAPGEHRLTFKAASDDLDIMAPARFKNEAKVRFTAEPGRNYFYRVSLNLGWGPARLSLIPLDSAAGRAAVAAAQFQPTPVPPPGTPSAAP